MNTMSGTYKGTKCVIHNMHDDYMMIQTESFIGKVHVSEVLIDWVSVMDEINAKYDAMEVIDLDEKIAA